MTIAMGLGVIKSGCTTDVEDSSTSAIDRGSYMSAHVLLHLLNELRKRDKMLGKPRILSLFRNELNKFNNTRDVFYVRREVDVIKTAKANAYIIHIFGKIELLSIHAT